MNLSLYGARDAAQNWTKEYTKVLLDLGFIAGHATPCKFYCEERELFVTVHGDDFTAAGPKGSLEWLKSGLESAWEIKADFLGPQTEGC